MKNKDKTETQLIEELKKLRKRLTELENSESERNNVEEKQKKTEERHKISPEFLLDGYLHVDLKGKITDCNSAFLNNTGYSREDIVNKHFTKLPTVRLKDIPRYIKMYNSTRRGKFPKSIEYEWIHKDGTTRWGEAYFSIVRKKRRILGFNIITRDITDRKKIEDHLKKSEQNLIKAQEIGRIGSWEWDAKTDKGSWSEQVNRMFGIEPGEIDISFEFLLERIHPDDKERVKKEIEKAVNEQKNIDMEYRVFRKDGSECTVHSRAEIRLDETGKSTGLTGIIQDITERRQAEKELRESEEKYRILFEKMMNAFALHEIVVNKKGKPVDYVFLKINSAFELLTGLKRKNLIGKKVTEALPGIEKDPADWIGIYGKVALTGQEIRFVQYAQPLSKWYSVLAYSPQKGLFATIFEDITQRKKIEEDLKTSEEKYRSLIESTDDLIYLVDKNYSYIFMNKKHAERFNLPFKKIVGRSYSEFHSKKESEFFRKDVNKVIRTGHSIRHEHESGRDGKFYLRTYSPVKNEKGEVITVNVISKDISELKQVENELKKSEQEIHKFAENLQIVREKERALVASELHDEVGQALTGLKMDLFMVKNKMSKDKKEIPGEFQKMEKLLDASIQKLRKIYSDLRPSLLDHFGVGEAMRQYVNDFLEHSVTKCTFYQDPEEILLGENRSIALYRIFQGAINNIRWHSQATKVDIRLAEKGPNLKLTIRDNGKGIKEKQINSGESFGLIGMRERARFLGGKLDIKGIPDKGTTVKLEFPLNPQNH